MFPYTAFDIETAPTQRSLDLPYPIELRKPPGNMSKADTIAAWRERDREDWNDERIRDYSLDRRYGRVVAISLGFREGDKISLTAIEEADEKVLVESALQVFNLCDSNHPAVSFNGKEFDWPYLLYRGCVLGIRFWDHIAPDTLKAMTLRYTKTHVDLRKILTFEAYQAKGKLGDFCESFGLPNRNEDKSQVFQFVQQGNAKALAAFCDLDMQDTAALYERVEPLVVAQSHFERGGRTDG